MRKWLALSMLFLGCYTQAFSDQLISTLWKRGNELYQAKNYDSALACFEKLAAVHSATPELYYNLANIHYRLNHIGKAVLYYKRALELRPGYADAIANLELTQSRIPNRIVEHPEIFFVRWWSALTHPSSANIWAGASLVFFLILLALALRRATTKQNRIPLFAFVTTGFILTVSLICAFAAAKRSAFSAMAVVMTNDAVFKDGSTSNARQSLIPEGTVVKIDGELNAAWIPVNLPDGRTGFIERARIEPI